MFNPSGLFCRRERGPLKALRCRNDKRGAYFRHLPTSRRQGCPAPQAPWNRCTHPQKRAKPFAKLNADIARVLSETLAQYLTAMARSRVRPPPAN